MSAPGADAVTAAPASAEETPVEVAQAGGATSAPPVPNLKHFDESSGKTIVLPSDDVKARLLERQRKQKERAEAARAEVAAKIAEREKAEREGVREGAITKPTEMSPAEKSGEKEVTGDEAALRAEKSAALQAEKAKKLARQQEIAARRAVEKAAPKISAMDANAKFLASAAAREAAAGEDGGAAVSPVFAKQTSEHPVSGKHSIPPIDVRSFDEIMAAKKHKETEMTDEERAAAAAAEEKLTHKTITMKTADNQSLEISMKVHIPQERLAQLEARKKAKEAARREREEREARARSDRQAIKKDENGEVGNKKEEEQAPVADASVENKNEKQISPEKPLAKEESVPEAMEEPAPEPAAKSTKRTPAKKRSKTNETPPEENTPKRARRSTRK